MAFLLKRRDGRDIAKDGTVPFKTGRMVSLSIGQLYLYNQGQSYV
jgi:hypothetical protein